MPISESWMADIKYTEEFMPSGLKNPQEAIATWKNFSKNRIFQSTFLEGQSRFSSVRPMEALEPVFIWNPPSEIWSSDLGRSFTKMTEEIHSEVRNLYLIVWCLKWCHWIFNLLPKYIWKWWWSRLNRLSKKVFSVLAFSCRSRVCIYNCLEPWC